VVTHRRVVQGEQLGELLGVPGLLSDGAQHVPADGSPNAAPKEPPKQPSKAVHADPRSQTETVSSTFPSTVEVVSPDPSQRQGAFSVLREPSQIVSESAPTLTRDDLGRIL